MWLHPRRAPSGRASSIRAYCAADQTDLPNVALHAGPHLMLSVFQYRSRHSVLFATLGFKNEMDAWVRIKDAKEFNNFYRNAGNLLYFCHLFKSGS